MCQSVVANAKQINLCPVSAGIAGVLMGCRTTAGTAITTPTKCGAKPTARSTWPLCASGTPTTVNTHANQTHDGLKNTVSCGESKTPSGGWRSKTTVSSSSWSRKSDACTSLRVQLVGLLARSQPTTSCRYPVAGGTPSVTCNPCASHVTRRRRTGLWSSGDTAISPLLLPTMLGRVRWIGLSACWQASPLPSQS
jgi:hypothetical protein